MSALRLTILVVLAAAATALAQSEDSLNKAKELYKRGAERFDKGDYAGAISDFNAADQIVAKPAFSFNLAKAHDKLKDPGRAIYYYQQYLDRDRAAADKTQVIGEIARLRTELKKSGKALVIVNSTPAGAAVTTSGAFVGVTPLPMTLSEGEHNFRLELGGLPSQDARTTVKPGDVSELKVALGAGRPSAPVAVAPPPSPERREAPPSASGSPSGGEDWTAPPPPPPPPSPSPEAGRAGDVPPPPPPPLATTQPATSGDPVAVRVVGSGGSGPDANVHQPVKSKSKVLTVLKWTGVGFTVAAAGGGTYFGWVNLDSAEALRTRRNQMTQVEAEQMAARGNQAGMFANIAFITAGALFLGTTVLFVLDPIVNRD